MPWRETETTLRTRTRGGMSSVCIDLEERSISSPERGRAMSTESNKAIAAAVVNPAMNRGDLEAVDEYLATDYIEHDALPLMVSRAGRG